jgi:hypothetical protein
MASFLTFRLLIGLKSRNESLDLSGGHEPSTSDPDGAQTAFRDEAMHVASGDGENIGRVGDRKEESSRRRWQVLAHNDRLPKLQLQVRFR